MPIIRIPSLRSLTLNDCGCDDPIHAINLRTSLASQLERLIFKSCLASVPELAALLVHCPKLKYLLIEFEHRHSNYWRSLWPTLGWALRRLKAREHLRLDHQHDRHLTTERREMYGLRDLDDDNDDDDVRTMRTMRAIMMTRRKMTTRSKKMKTRKRMKTTSWNP